MLNCVNLFKELSGYSIKLGLPKKYVSCDGCPEASEASASTAIGMILAVKGDKSINCINDVTFRPSQRNNGSAAVQDSTDDATRFDEYKPDSDGATITPTEMPNPVKPEEPHTANPVGGGETGEDTNTDKVENTESPGTPGLPDGDSGKDDYRDGQGANTQGTEPPVGPEPEPKPKPKPGPKPRPEPEPGPKETKNPIVKFFWRLYDNVQKDVND